MSLPRAGYCFWLVEENFLRGTTSKKHNPDLGSDASSEWYFCTRFSDFFSRGNQWWRRQMMAVFSGYTGDWTGDYLAWCVHTLMRNVTFWVLFYAIFTIFQLVDKSARNAPGMKKFEKRTVNFFSKYSVFLIVEYLIFMVYFLFWAFQYSVRAIYNWPSKPDQEPVQRR